MVLCFMYILLKINWEKCVCQDILSPGNIYFRDIDVHILIHNIAEC